MNNTSSWPNIVKVCLPGQYGDCERAEAGLEPTQNILMEKNSSVAQFNQGAVIGVSTGTL